MKNHFLSEKIRMGLSFNDFLNDPELAALDNMVRTGAILNDDHIVDPWSKYLTEHEKGSIMDRCRYSIWWFLRYVIKINDESFHLSEARVQFIWLFTRGYNVIFLGTRQITEKTTTLIALAIYELLFKKNDYIYLPGFNRQSLLAALRQISIPEWMMSREEYTKAMLKQFDAYPVSGGVYFINDIMHSDREYLGNFDSPNSKFYGVGTLGPYNAMTYLRAIPFRTDMMFDAKIDKFVSSYYSLTGDKPCFSILCGDEEIQDFPEQLKQVIDPKSDAYHREISIRPMPHITL